MKRKIIIFTLIILLPYSVGAAGGVIINEVAWMGTKANAADEWIELYNPGGGEIDLTGWQLYESGGNTLIINLAGKIPAGGYYLIERTDDNSISDITADIFGPFGGSGLKNSGEYLVLKNSSGETIDSVNATSGWPAGDSASKASMERKADGTWQTNDNITINGHDVQGNPIVGTPKSFNSQSSAAASSTPPATTAPSGGSGSSGSSINPVPLKAEAGADVVAEIAQTIKFNAAASQGATTYKWYLGDGAIQDGLEATHVYKFPGTYLVTLEVTNGTETSWDQLRVSIFGGRAVINEFFTATASSTGQWLEIFNPTSGTLDLSGWIIEAGGKSFTVPPFVIIPAGSYLVLSNEIMGLNFGQPGKIDLKYPNGLVVDEVVLEKIEPNASACRSANGFYWSREPTPGRANIILASGASLSNSVTAAPNKIAWHPDIKPVNLVKSIYDKVADLDVVEAKDEKTQENTAVSGIISFLKSNYGKTWFWVLGVIVLSAAISLIYIKIIKKTG